MNNIPKITLTKSRGYILTASTDDKLGSRIAGYYSDYNIAKLKSKAIGWFGSDGHVTPVDMWLDENGKFYIMKVEAGTFTDVTENLKELMEASIKSKLTPEELEFLGVK